MYGLRKRVLPVLPGFLLVFMITMINAFLMPRFIKLFYSNLLVALPVALLALGETLVLIVGEVDLSLGATLMFVNAITVAAFTDYNINGPLFLLVPIITGLIVGALHGFLVSFGRVNSFLATVGTSFVWGGMALAILREPRGSVPAWFSNVFTGGLAGVPFSLWMLVFIFLAWISFDFSPLSTNFFAVGSSSRAAFSMGLNVNRVKFYAFILNGLFVGVAGLTMTGIIGSGDPRLSGFSTIQAILAALIGGASFAGGRGNGFGAALAAIGLQFVRNLVAWLGISYYFLDLAYGCIILALIAMITVVRTRIEEKG